MKKRHIYGTVMIDIETRNIVDLIESRDSKDVADWLSKYPNLQIVSRDGANTYANAIKEAHPAAIQISDRFHLLKSLIDYCKSYISKTMSFKVKIDKTTASEYSITSVIIFTNRQIRAEKAKELYTKGIAPYQISKTLKMDIRTVIKYTQTILSQTESKEIVSKQTAHDVSVNKKSNRVQNVRELYNEGYVVTAISRETGLAIKTVKRYLDPNCSVVQAAYGSTKASPLADYHSIIDELISKRCTFKQIENTIRENGYTGSSSAIRMYATRKRKLTKESIKAEEEGIELIERQHLVKLLYKPLDKVKEISAAQLEAVFKKYPLMSQLYGVVESFKKLLHGKTPDGLYHWIENARLLNLPEISSFINGMLRDIDAVKNSIAYDYRYPSNPAHI